MRHERTIYIHGADGFDTKRDVTLRLTSAAPVTDEKISDAIQFAMMVADVKTPEAMADVVERRLQQDYDIYCTIIHQDTMFEMEPQHGVIVATPKPLTR